VAAPLAIVTAPCLLRQLSSAGPESIPISGQAAPRAWSQVAGSCQASDPRAGRWWHHRAMSEIRRLDFLGVPSQDADRARAFYRDTLGLRPDEHAEYECWAGETCLAIWMPEQIGMTFVAQKGNPLPLGVEGVGAARAALESKGVTFSGDTLDTGVCHMAFFTDPDGNDLMLHHRYAPYPDRQSA
jgi:catechol 2,3-dioxygenase-like lactoylglutathione lyase family enzyme